jgi:hypothetical protein
MRKYGMGRLLIDIILTFVTGGLWLIVILIMFLRRNSR